MESFEHIGFLLHFGDKGSDVPSLSQATPFFKNSDPDMPAAPVPVSQVYDWLLKSIASALKSISDGISGKENGPPNASDQDAGNADASGALNKLSTNDRGPCIIEGVSKTSLFKQASDLKSTSVKVRIVQLISNPSHFVAVGFLIPFLSLMYARQLHVIVYSAGCQLP